MVKPSLSCDKQGICVTEGLVGLEIRIGMKMETSLKILQGKMFAEKAVGA
jgi:hypothetical protein